MNESIEDKLELLIGEKEEQISDCKRIIEQIKNIRHELYNVDDILSITYNLKLKIKNIEDSKNGVINIIKSIEESKKESLTLCDDELLHTPDVCFERYVKRCKDFISHRFSIIIGHVLITDGSMYTIRVSNNHLNGYVIYYFDDNKIFRYKYIDKKDIDQVVI